MSESEDQGNDPRENEADQLSAGQYEDPRDPDARVLRDISAGIIRLFEVHFGRQPKSVETHFASPNILVALVTDSLTPVERTLRDVGETQRLRSIRLILQHTAESRFRAIVETVTGRRVVGFMSGMDVNVDESCEVFTLVPEAGRS